MTLKQKARKQFGQQPAGHIMFLTLTFAVLLGLASVIAIGPSVGEALKSGQELRDKRLFFLADGGAALCRGELKNRLNLALPARLATIATASAFTTFKTTYVDANDPALFLKDYTYDSTNASQYVAGVWTKVSTTRVSLQPSSGQYQCAITVDSRMAPISSVSGLGSTALFRYRYTINGTGAEGGVTRSVNLQGTFSVLVQQDNFARYALFTNDQGGIYFNTGMDFYGPVHTNTEFNVKGYPHFWDTIESVATKVKYGNGASPAVPIELYKTDPVYDHNGTIDVPVYDMGLTLGASSITLPTTTTGDAQKTTALTGISAPATNGVYLGYSGTAMTGGIYVKGDASMNLSVQTGSVAQFSITQGTDTWTVQVDKPNNQTKIKKNAGSYTTYTGLPNGLLYVDGSVTGLAGTLQRDTQLTVAATNDVTITGNLVYENYTPAAGGNPPSADGTTNLMGVLSWNKNIHIGTSAPDDVTICGTLMAPSTTSGQGQVLVDSYNSTTLGSHPNTSAPRGNATVLGGVIMNTYGAFGTVAGNPPNQTYTGYSRNFVYDKRMARGMAPPYFPTTGKVIDSLTGITDRPNWQQN